MTVQESLQSLTQYPVSDKAIARICLVRGLDVSSEITLNVATSKEFELACADVYMYVVASPSLKEQEVSMTLRDSKWLKRLADSIYGKYGDPAFDGGVYGHIGDDWNG